MESVGLYVSVPIACFRVPRAREYFETFPCPAPSTVYGMLLSMVGEVNRREHEGAEIAIALLGEPGYSVVLRTLWRVKNRREGPGLKNNRRPDFQELLSDTQIAVWIRKGANEKAPRSLAARVEQAMQHPSTISRFGGLSLGESTHLVNDISTLDNKV
ncbi:MAG: type I-MYXAN CRISPR-associated protein Cas5/Cmx5/DevS, partial [Pyrinomonadaceae bacterium]